MTLNSLKSQTEFQYNLPCGLIQFYYCQSFEGSNALLQVYKNDTLSYANLGGKNFPQTTLYGNESKLIFEDSINRIMITATLSDNDSYQLTYVKNGVSNQFIFKEASSLGYEPVDFKCFEAHRSAKVNDGVEDLEVWLHTSRSLLLADSKKHSNAKALNELFLKIYSEKSTQISDYPEVLVKNKDILLVQDFSSVYESEANEDGYLMAADWNSDEMMGMNYISKDFLNINIGVSEYTGGAHGFFGVFYFLYNVNKQKIYALSDIFLPGYETILLEKLNTARKEYYIAMEEEFIPDNEFFISENFYATPQSMVFAYNPYEAGPFSMGIIELEIPLDEIKNLMKPDVFEGLIKNYWVTLLV